MPQYQGIGQGVNTGSYGTNYYATQQLPREGTGVQIDTSGAVSGGGGGGQQTQLPPAAATGAINPATGQAVYGYRNASGNLIPSTAQDAYENGLVYGTYIPAYAQTDTYKAAFGQPAAPAPQVTRRGLTDPGSSNAKYNLTQAWLAANGGDAKPYQNYAVGNQYNYTQPFKVGDSLESIQNLRAFDTINSVAGLSRLSPLYDLNSYATNLTKAPGYTQGLSNQLSQLRASLEADLGLSKGYDTFTKNKQSLTGLLQSLYSTQDFDRSKAWDANVAALQTLLPSTFQTEMTLAQALQNMDDQTGQPGSFANQSGIGTYDPLYGTDQLGSIGSQYLNFADYTGTPKGPQNGPIGSINTANDFAPGFAALLGVLAQGQAAGYPAPPALAAQTGNNGQTSALSPGQKWASFSDLWKYITNAPGRSMFNSRAGNQRNFNENTYNQLTDKDRELVNGMLGAAGRQYQRAYDQRQARIAGKRKIYGYT
jgi:hypothetical protein